MQEILLAMMFDAVGAVVAALALAAVRYVVNSLTAAAS